MDKKKIQLIAVGVLGFILILLLLNPKGGRKKKAPKASIAPENSMESLTGVLERYSEVSKNQIDLDLILEVENKFEGMDLRRDPFSFSVDFPTEGVVTEEISVPETLGSDPIPNFQIEGVLFDPVKPANSIAILMGEEKKIGDEVLGWRIINMKDNIVVFEKNGQRHVENLYGESE